MTRPEPIRRRAGRGLCVVAAALAFVACAPKVGSDRWCETMKETPRGEWSANDATAFAKHCVLGLKPDK